MEHLQWLEARTLLAAPATGLQATYFDDSNLVGSSRQATGVGIALNWGSAAPIGGIGADTFSLRLTGKLKAPTSESYRFYFTTDGGVRMWLGHSLVIDSWATTDAVRTLKATISLTANQFSDLQIEYRHNVGAAQLTLKWQTDTRAKSTVPAGALTPQLQSLADQIDHAIAFARSQVGRTMAELSPGAYPYAAKADGTWSTVAATDWTSGYFGGQLWQLDKLVGGYSAAATAWSTPLASQSTQPGDHFSRLWTTFKPLYDKTGNAAYRQVLLDAAANRNANWSDKVRAFKTPELASNSGKPNATFGILMDQTLDLELLLWAADQTNNQVYRDRVAKHMQTVITNMVRAGGNVYQRAFFDPNTGALVSQENYQGYSNSSTWSRGQAWAVYSFTRLAQLTGRAELLTAAKKVCDYWIANVPPDAVPYWDFQLPAGARMVRDSSAAAIAVSGLLRMSKLSTTSSDKAKYKQFAEKTLGSLLSPAYLVEGQYGSGTIASRGILAHGSQHVPKNKAVDTAINFGDYHLLLSLVDYRSF
jgi:unsaturated chondroitin disaccharide hydrolase